MRQHGFTVIELLMAIVLTGIVTTGVFTFFNTQANQYFKLNTDSQNYSDLAVQSQRIAKVLRGLTDITVANDNDITVYAYFSPRDNTVSQIRYYKNAAATTLYADVTPLTANPPSGTLLTAQKKTYTIIPNFFTVTGSKLFTYLDSTGWTIATPISDLHTIKGVKINLAVPAKNPGPNGNTSMTLQVSLRNRKTNL